MFNPVLLICDTMQLNDLVTCVSLLLKWNTVSWKKNSVWSISILRVSSFHVSDNIIPFFFFFLYFWHFMDERNLVITCYINWGSRGYIFCAKEWVITAGSEGILTIVSVIMKKTEKTKHLKFKINSYTPVFFSYSVWNIVEESTARTKLM